MKVDYTLFLAEKNPSRSDIWFAWFPVQCGALSTGHWLWMQKVWRNRCGGVSIYQPLKIK